MVADILKAIPRMNVEVGEGYPNSVVGTLSYGIGPSIANSAEMDTFPISKKPGIPIVRKMAQAVPTVVCCRKK